MDLGPVNGNGGKIIFLAFIFTLGLGDSRVLKYNTE